ncbi:lactonase family protein [Microbacterium sp. 2MCAF23]|uniref:lactonase family protein n=1 Tax=Microbacterium sp. 2MCAF23 TaxID=3232985 RepID=UPI003F997E15
MVNNRKGCTMTSLAPPAALLVAGRGEEPGLYRLARAGAGIPAEQVAAVDQPVALCRHPRAPLVYGLIEDPAGRATVMVWSVVRGKPELLAATALPLASIACDVAVSPDGAVLAAVAFGSEDSPGDAVLLRLDADGLPEGTSPERLGGMTHPHQAVFTGTELYVPDLGADLVHRYRLGDAVPERLPPLAVPAGTGPRHLVVLREDPGAAGAPRTIAVSGELGETVCRGEVSGDRVIWHSTPSTRVTGAARSRSPRNYPGDIKHVSPGAVLVTNRGHDTLALVAIDETVPRLIDEMPLAESWPQHIAVVDGRIFVACWDSDLVVEVAVGPDGRLERRGESRCAGASWVVDAVGALSSVSSRTDDALRGRT